MRNALKLIHFRQKFEQRHRCYQRSVSHVAKFLREKKYTQMAAWRSPIGEKGDATSLVLHIRGRRCDRKVLTSCDCISIWRTATKDAGSGEDFHKVSRLKWYYFTSGAAARRHAVADTLARLTSAGIPHFSPRPDRI